MKKEIRKEFEESVYEFCESCIEQGIVKEEQIIKEYTNENKHMIKKGIITKEDVENAVYKFLES